MTPSSPPLLRSLLALLVGGGLALAGIGPAHGQSGLRSVQAVGTGGGTSPLNTGPAALYSNPANLTVGPAEHALEIQLFRVSAYTGGDFYQFEHITPLFYDDEAAISDAEQTAILDEWFGNETRSANAYAEFIPVSITYRPSDASWAAGFGIRGRVFQTSAVNKGVYEGFLRDEPVPIDGRARLYSTVDLAGAFSYRLSSLPLSVGASPRLIFGTSYSDGAIDSRGTVGSDPILHEFDITARAAGALSRGLYDTFDAFSSEPVDDVVKGSAGIEGIGGAVDLGATYTVRPDLHVSASVTDLGRITWTGDAQTVTAVDTFRFEGVSLDLNRLDEEYDGDVGSYVEDQIDSLAQEAYQVERERSSFSTGLPTTLHVSGTWDQGMTTLNGGVSVGLNEEAGAVPDPVAVHVGGTLNLGPVPVRAGARFFGAQAVTLSGGFGLDFGFYRFDLGASLTPDTSTLGSGARYAVSVSLATIRL